MTDETTPPEPKPSVLAEAADLIRIVGGGLLIALVARILIFQPYTIPSESMEPGLLVGDYIVVSKFDYGWSRHSIPFSPPLPSGRLFGRSPKRGEAAVFQLPHDDRQTYIKRIVGLPGDRVQVRAGLLYVNDQPIKRAALGSAVDPGEVAVRVEQFRETWPNGQSYVTFDRGPDHDGDDTPVMIVPEGHYFAMGDNRDNSLDSRWPGPPGVGLVPAENLVGKARTVLFSWRRRNGSWLDFASERVLKSIR